MIEHLFQLQRWLTSVSTGIIWREYAQTWRLNGEVAEVLCVVFRPALLFGRGSVHQRPFALNWLVIVQLTYANEAESTPHALECAARETI
jgi:hypothetical protein